MWSGLLPPGIRESDNEEEEEAEPESAVPYEDLQWKPASQLTNAEESNGVCPPGVSPDMWHKFQELQKKNAEMKTQLNQRERGRRRKRKRKGAVDKPEGAARGESVSQPSTSDAPLEELKQFFGINDRFEPPVTTKILQKSGLETSIDQAVDGGDIEKAEELSDKLATREFQYDLFLRKHWQQRDETKRRQAHSSFLPEMGVKISKAVACRNFVKAKQEDMASQEARRKKKKLAWG